VPQGYAIRGASHDDVPSVLAVASACDLEESGGVDMHETWLRDDWRRPRFDPSTDAWIVTGPDGDVVAAAYTWDEEPLVTFDSGGWVHPMHRGRGLGTALAASVETRAIRDVAQLPPGSAPRVHQWFDAANARASALFERRGYAPEREFLHMQIDVAPGLQAGSAPDGIGIRPRGEDDDRAIFAAVDEAFREHWGYRPEPYDEWVSAWQGSATYDPTLWFVATDGEELVGAALCTTLEDRGWIGDLAVRPGWRRRGIGEALLRAAFARFAERGLPSVMLNVDRDNTTGATRVYERAGMRVRRRWLVMAKTLTGVPRG
jgi:mycothiol synthase